MKKLSLKERLMQRIKKNEKGCWEWQGSIAKGRYPYGFISTSDGLQNTHRVAWKLFRGSIPRGMLVCHTCDNPRCCNPDHLFVGTQKDNLDDRKRKGRTLTGQRHPNSAITDSLAEQLRKEFDGVRGSIRRLSEKHGITSDVVRNVVRNLSYQTQSA